MNLRAVVLLAGMLPGLALGFRGGAPLRSTSAPGDSTCNQCHGRSLNAGGGSLKITPTGAAYRPGVPIRIRVTLSDPNALRWGFHLAARQGSDNRTAAGRFQQVEGDSSTQTLTMGETMTHTYDGVRDRQTGSVSWEVVWTPPAEGAGTVTFYASGNAANGDGDNWGDDQIYTGQTRLPEAGSADARRWVAPDDGAGEGWVRQIRLLNASDRSVEARVAAMTAAGEQAGEEWRATLGPWQVVTREWPGAAAWFDAALEDGTRMELVLVHSELGRRVVAAEKKSGEPRALALEPAPHELLLLNPGGEDGEFELIWRDPAGGEIGRESVQVAARQQLPVAAPDAAASVAVQGRGAAFTVRSRSAAGSR